MLFQLNFVHLWLILWAVPRSARTGEQVVSSRSVRLPVTRVCASPNRCQSSILAAPKASGDQHVNPPCLLSIHLAHRPNPLNVSSASRCSSPRMCCAIRPARLCCARRLPTQSMLSTETGTSAPMPLREQGKILIIPKQYSYI